MMTSRIRLALVGFLLGFCSLSYEFLLAQMMSILEGHTVFYYSMTIGLFIFALGLGSLMPAAGLNRQAVLQRLIAFEILIAALGGAAPFILAFINVLARENYLPWPDLSFLLGHSLLVMSIGCLSGMELPLLLRVAEAQGDEKIIIKLLALDYLASFLGAVCLPLWLFPSFGLVQTSLLLGTLNLLAALALVHGQLAARFGSFIVMLLILFSLAFRRADSLQAELSRLIMNLDQRGAMLRVKQHPYPMLSAMIFDKEASDAKI